MNPFQKLLIVDDSAFYAQVFKLELLKYLDIDIQCVQSAKGAFDRLATDSFDILLMDVIMPDMDGLMAIQEVKSRYPQVTLVMMSSAESGQLKRMGFDVSILDAVTFIAKPKSREDMKVIAEQLKGGGFGQRNRSLLTSNDSDAFEKSIEVLRRRSATSQGGPQSNTGINSAIIRCIGIVVSTGGPNTLVEILSLLPSDFRIPILIVQHMSAGFSHSFVSWLDERIPLSVQTAQAGQRLTAGVWIAPDNAHLMVRNGRLVLDVERPAYKYFKPSGNYLLDSIAQEYHSHGLGVVLTGLGQDGAEGLGRIVNLRGTAIVQEPKTCVIAGMVNTALRQMKPHHILSPKEVGAFLRQLAEL